MADQNDALLIKALDGLKLDDNQKADLFDAYYADNGDQALSILKKHKGTIDNAILDSVSNAYKYKDPSKITSVKPTAQPPVTAPTAPAAQAPVAKPPVTAPVDIKAPKPSHLGQNQTLVSPTTQPADVAPVPQPPVVAAAPQPIAQTSVATTPPPTPQPGIMERAFKNANLFPNGIGFRPILELAKTPLSIISTPGTIGDTFHKDVAKGYKEGGAGGAAISAVASPLSMGASVIKHVGNRIMHPLESFAEDPWGMALDVASIAIPALRMRGEIANASRAGINAAREGNGIKGIFKAAKEGFHPTQAQTPMSAAEREVIINESVYGKKVEGSKPVLDKHAAINTTPLEAPKSAKESASVFTSDQVPMSRRRLDKQNEITQQKTDRAQSIADRQISRTTQSIEDNISELESKGGSFTPEAKEQLRSLLSDMDRPAINTETGMVKYTKQPDTGSPKSGDIPKERTFTTDAEGRTSSTTDLNTDRKVQRTLPSAAPKALLEAPEKPRFYGDDKGQVLDVNRVLDINAVPEPPLQLKAGESPTTLQRRAGDPPRKEARFHGDEKGQVTDSESVHFESPAITNQLEGKPTPKTLESGKIPKQLEPTNLDYIDPNTSSTIVENMKKLSDDQLKDIVTQYEQPHMIDFTASDFNPANFEKVRQIRNSAKQVLKDRATQPTPSLPTQEPTSISGEINSAGKKADAPAKAPKVKPASPAVKAEVPTTEASVPTPKAEPPAPVVETPVVPPVAPTKAKAPKAKAPTPTPPAAPVAPTPTATVTEPLTKVEPVTSPVPERLSVPEDTVTLYRGESRTGKKANLPDWVESDPKFKASQDAEGRWFSDDMAEAQYYVDNQGATHLTKVDVPKSKAESFRVSNLSKDHPARKFSARPDKELFVDREIADKAIPHTKPVSPTVEKPLTGDIPPMPKKSAAMAEPVKPATTPMVESVASDIEIIQRDKSGKANYREGGSQGAYSLEKDEVLVTRKSASDPDVLDKYVVKVNDKGVSIIDENDIVIGKFDKGTSLEDALSNHFKIKKPEAASAPIPQAPVTKVKSKAKSETKVLEPASTKQEPKPMNTQTTTPPVPNLHRSSNFPTPGKGKPNKYKAGPEDKVTIDKSLTSPDKSSHQTFEVKRAKKHENFRAEQDTSQQMVKIIDDDGKVVATFEETDTTKAIKRFLESDTL